ncbi:MAG: hypothetical protein H6R00_364 [Proteobacteria bacterium]|nr:hypothetical protein [Pseudomonadota bacterium]
MLNAQSAAVASLAAYLTQATGEDQVKQPFQVIAAEPIGSFYATAYNIDGNIVIAYRGTDDLGDVPTDAYLGTGGGASSQAIAALAFYQQISEQHPGQAITLVGHSLGGGLAGYVSALTHSSAVVFDNAPFEAAAANAFASIHDLWEADQYIEHNGPGTASYDEETYATNVEQYTLLYGVWEEVYDGLTSSGEPVWDNNFSARIGGYAVKGEMLEAARSLQTTHVESLEIGDGVGLSTFQLHSASLLAIRLFGEDASQTGSEAWKTVASYIFESLYKEDVAGILGYHSASDLRDAIATSTIADNTSIYGSSAASSFYSGANAIGSAYSAGLGANTGIPSSVGSYYNQQILNVVAGLSTQYAGYLALNDVAAQNISEVVSYQSGNKVLIADYSDETWSAWGAAPSELWGRAELLRSAVSLGWGDLSTTSPDTEIDILKEMSWFYGSSSSEALGTIKTFIVACSASGFEGTVPTGHDGTAFLGTSEADQIKGSDYDDLIFTGGINPNNRGNDVADYVDGGQGKDLIVGGYGVDKLSGGIGRDYVLGNAGDDVLIGGTAKDEDLVGGDASNVSPLFAQYHRDWNDGERDFLTGGTGNDLYCLSGFYFANSYYGGGEPVPYEQDVTDMADFINGDDADFSAYYQIYTKAGQYETSPEKYFGCVEITSAMLESFVQSGQEEMSFDPEQFLYGELNDSDYDYVVGMSYSYVADVGYVIVAKMGINVIELYNAILGYFYLPDDGTNVNSVPGDIILEGNEGANHITGNSQDNTMAGGGGNDTLNGGGGYDTAGFTGALDDYEFSVAADGRLIVSDTRSTTSLVSRSADAGSPDGTDVLENVEMLAFGFESFGPDYATYSLGLDAVWFKELQTTTRGDDTNNTLVGGIENDFLSGRAGDDYIEGGSGNNVLFGGEGNDTIRGGTGNDLIDGGEGTQDYVTYWNALNGVKVSLLDGVAEGEGADRLFNIENVWGSDFNDQIIGDNNNNGLFGAVGDDDLQGGAGDDNLDGGAGNDTLSGGEGADHLYGGDGDDALDGGDGTDDWVTYWDANGVTVNLTDGTATGQGTDTISNIESVWGSAGNDSLTGNGQDNGLFGADGNDFIWGVSGYNTLDGGTGDDDIVSGHGNDAIEGGEGTDTVEYWWSTTGVTVSLAEGVAHGDGDDTLSGIENAVGSAFNDTLTGNEGDNQLYGDAGNDVLWGLAGNDYLNASEGNDVLNGGAGDDHLDGGVGSDTFHFDPSFGHDTVDDFSVGDIIEFASSVFADFGAMLDAASEVDGSTVIAFDGDNSVTLQNVALASLSADEFRFAA